MRHSTVRYSPYMEAPRPAYPPEYDEPYTTAGDVLDVFFGRQAYDGKGRNHNDLMCSTSMAHAWEHITGDTEAEREIRMLVWRHLHSLPQTKKILDELAAATAKE